MKLYQECAFDIILSHPIRIDYGVINEKHHTSHVGYIPEGPIETELEVPPSLPPKTNTQLIEVALPTHSFAVTHDYMYQTVSLKR